MGNRTYRAALVSLFFMVAGLLAACPSGTEDTPPGPPLELTLAVRSAPYSGLIAIADEKGYFRDAGLSVSLHAYPSGKAALEAVSRGEAQVATVADIAFAAKALEDPSVRVLASIGTTVGDQIVARRDQNILTPGDLRGRKIGVTSGTTSDYFLYTFLLIENIPLSDVVRVEIPAPRQVEALVNGEVDAVSAFQVYAIEARKRLGDNAVYWDSQDRLAYHWLLAFRQDLAARPESLKRLLRALIRAEAFAAASREEAGILVARKWGFGLSPGDTRVGVSFGQSIVTALHSYLRWHLKNAGETAAPPDALSYLHTGILDEVAPDLMTISR